LNFAWANAIIGKFDVVFQITHSSLSRFLYYLFQQQNQVDTKFPTFSSIIQTLNFVLDYLQQQKQALNEILLEILCKFAWLRILTGIRIEENNETKQISLIMSQFLASQLLICSKIYEQQQKEKEVAMNIDSIEKKTSNFFDSMDVEIEIRNFLKPNNEIQKEKEQNIDYSFLSERFKEQYFISKILACFSIYFTTSNQDKITLEQLIQSISSLKQIIYKNQTELPSFVHHFLGLLYFRISKMEESFKSFELASKSTKCHFPSEIMNMMGCVVSEHGSKRLAIRYFIDSFQIDAFNVASLFNISVQHREMGNLEKESHFLKLLLAALEKIDSNSSKTIQSKG